MKNFNIQLFAETPLNSTTTMTPEMKTFYEKRLIDQAEPRLVHDQFASRRLPSTIRSRAAASPDTVNSLG